MIVICCTLHYINNKFEFSSSVLGLYYLDQPHNANYLFENLKEILNEWNISENNIKYFIGDSESNVKAALEKFGRDFSKHIPCVVHKLNSCVNVFKIKIKGNQKLYK